MKYAGNLTPERLLARGQDVNYWSRWSRQEMRNDPRDGIQAQITIANAAYALCAAYAPHLIERLPELEVAYTANATVLKNARRARAVGNVAWLYGHAHHLRLPTTEAEDAERKLLQAV
jgi:hypothetical protein